MSTEIGFSSSDLGTLISSAMGRKRNTLVRNRLFILQVVAMVFRGVGQVSPPLHSISSLRSSQCKKICRHTYAFRTPSMEVPYELRDPSDSGSVRHQGRCHHDDLAHHMAQSLRCRSYCTSRACQSGYAAETSRLSEVVSSLIDLILFVTVLSFPLLTNALAGGTVK
jgi:hypothetical protein